MSKQVVEAFKLIVNTNTTSDGYSLAYPGNLLRLQVVGELSLYNNSPIPFGNGIPGGPINILFGMTAAESNSPPLQVSESNCNSANYMFWAGPPKYTAIAAETLQDTVHNNNFRIWHLGVDMSVDLNYAVPDATTDIWIQCTFTGNTFFDMGMYGYLKVRYEQWIAG